MSDQWNGPVGPARPRRVPLSGHPYIPTVEEFKNMDGVSNIDISDAFDEVEEAAADAKAFEVRRSALWASVTSFGGVDSDSDIDHEKRILDRAEVFVKYLMGEEEL
jgi:hypothetical protein